MKEYIDSPPPTTHAAIAPYKEDMEQALGGASNAPGFLIDGFGLIPQAVTSNPDISLPAKALYAYVASKAESSERVDISYDDILSDLHTTRRTLKRLCRELLSAGLMRAYIRRDAIAVGVRDLPYGIVRFWIPRGPIPADRRRGGALYVL